jgi:hypothetical protein
VASQSIHTPDPREVYQRPLKNLVGDRAVRSSFFNNVPVDKFPWIRSLLPQITASPESQWVVRNQVNKVLAMTLDHRGNVEYVWDNPEFTGTATAANVNGLLLPLGGLAEGLHALYFETFNAFGQRSPRQQISLLIDNNSPLVSIFYRSDHSLAYVVGPHTPLQFEVQDLETDGGSGILAVPGYPSGSVPANTTFTMGQTDLDEQGKAVGLVGADVTLSATALDLVNNQRTEEIHIFYDWTPPQFALQSVAEAIPLGGGKYRAFTDTVTITVQVTDGEPPIAQATTGTGDTWIR